MESTHQDRIAVINRPKETPAHPLFLSVVVFKKFVISQKNSMKYSCNSFQGSDAYAAFCILSCRNMLPAYHSMTHTPFVTFIRDLRTQKEQELDKLFSEINKLKP